MAHAEDVCARVFHCLAGQRGGAQDRLHGEQPPLRAEYSMFERGRYQRIGIEFGDDVWSQVSAELTNIVTGIESGWFPQTPPAPGFRFYTECLYCEPDELGTVDVHARWTVKRTDPRVTRWFGDAADQPAGPSDD